MSANLPLRDVRATASVVVATGTGYLMIGGGVLLLLAAMAFVWWQRRRRANAGCSCSIRSWQPPAMLLQNWRRLQDCCVAPRARHSPAVNPCAMMPGGSAWIRKARCPRRVAACWPGAYRPRVDANDVAALRSWARERYLAMLLERRR